MACDEIWKNLKGTSYEVSSFGNIRRNRYILKPFLNTSGYLSVKIHGITKQVHSLVNFAFRGKISRGHHIDHIDGNKLNNRLNNLEEVTHSENIRRAYSLGLRCSKGDRSNRAILCSREIPKIKQMREKGFTNKEIASKYGVHLSTISKVITGVNWKTK